MGISAICHKNKGEEEEKEEFGVRLGKLSGMKDYRKVFSVRLGIVLVFTRIIV